MAWNTYKGPWDPADFVVPPQLKKGESIRLQFYVQSAHYRLLNIIARSGHFPFEERNDVARFCIQFGLQHIDSLEGQNGITRSVMLQANMMNHRLQEHVQNETHRRWLENSKTVIFGFINAGQEDAAREEVAYLWAETCKMPEDPERNFRWKMKYIDALREQFKLYLPDEANAYLPGEASRAT